MFHYFFFPIHIFLIKVIFVQNHPYVKSTPSQTQEQIQLSSMFLEDSHKLSVKCREFLNAVCKYMTKQPTQPQMPPQQAVQQRPVNMMQNYPVDPNRTPPQMKGMPFKGILPNIMPNNMMMQPSQMK